MYDLDSCILLNSSRLIDQYFAPILTSIFVYRLTSFFVNWTSRSIGSFCWLSSSSLAWLTGSKPTSWIELFSSTSSPTKRRFLIGETWASNASRLTWVDGSSIALGVNGTDVVLEFVLCFFFSSSIGTFLTGSALALLGDTSAWSDLARAGMDSWYGYSW